ncbi:MAG TPA: response regulator transcription factor [Thermoanaerobaculia bacterium]|nr:response regulator transcription factor [Thermoanaerobaculia bacterium]
MVLIVDDDPGIRESLCVELRAAGYDAITAADGRAGLAAFRVHLPDLMITDLAMPGADGFALISGIRAFSRAPILVISVRGADADKIRALDLGADDFVTKPFSIPELLARIRAQLRRNSAGAPSMLSFDELAIDLERRRVTYEGREIKLTPTEFALLELLATRAGKPVLIEQIIARVWGSAPGTTHDTVRVHMSALRRKIEPDPARPRYIVTEPWIGYRFIAEPSPASSPPSSPT